MSTDEREILELALDLSDGQALKRDRVVPANPADHVIIDQLRVIARIAEAHRELRAPRGFPPPIPLAADRSVLHYRLLDELGAGGMGVVWRAEDTRLGRQVALKFLPDIVARDPERLARFEREARILAALNHPGIASLYGLEQIEDVRFLVLEYVPGETLARVLGAGPLETRRGLAICAHIAEALEAAHAKGVIHRDLKPSNVMLSPGDRVKLLDFGLAKALASSVDAGAVPAAGFETLSGVPIGTPAYASPEQIGGLRLDRATDVWSLGCVLYECLAGRPAFAAPSRLETVQAVVEGEPDWAAVPRALPVAVVALLKDCLRKDRAGRLLNAADARRILETAAAPPLEPVPSRRGQSPWIWFLAGLAIGGLVTWLVLR